MSQHACTMSLTMLLDAFWPFVVEFLGAVGTQNAPSTAQVKYTHLVATHSREEPPAPWEWDGGKRRPTWPKQSRRDETWRSLAIKLGRTGKDLGPTWAQLAPSLSQLAPNWAQPEPNIAQRGQVWTQVGLSMRLLGIWPCARPKASKGTKCWKWW